VSCGGVVEDGECKECGTEHTHCMVCGEKMVDVDNPTPQSPP
jgi:hypothetical protein